jgi:hypothetical protein
VAVSAQDRATLPPLLEAMEAALWRDGLLGRPAPPPDESEVHPS